MQTSRSKILSIILVIVLIAAGFYYYRQYSGSFSQVTSLVTEESAPPVGEDLLVLIQKLDYIKIDNDILASALFTTLVDTSVSISEEEKSKADPFAPLVSQTQTVQTNQTTIQNPLLKKLTPPKR